MNAKHTGAAEAPHLLLARMIQVVGFFLAAFGGFLLKIAPPEGAGPGFAVGVASFLTLGVLLFISAAASGPSRPSRAVWLTVAGIAFVLAAAAAFVYQGAFIDHVRPYPDPGSAELYIFGGDLTPAGAAYMEAHPRASEVDMVLDNGGLRARSALWTVDSIKGVKLRLTGIYVILVVALAVTIFSLTEGILVPRSQVASEPKGPTS